MATPRHTTTRSLKIYGFYSPVTHSTTSRTENLYRTSFTTVMYISCMLYLLLLSLLSPLLTGLPLLRPPIWYCHQKFKTTACTSLLPFPLLLSLSCCCNKAAATLLQWGYCKVAAATWLLQHCCCFLGGGSGFIKFVVALAAVDNTSAVEVHRAHYCLLET